ncbi:hypothetical protein BBO99_00008735 [Phytophthora kernoviae]|uniref:AAA+ ATPase domain-containing protein n=1 Tax=Phytophthora kernoviae TaxID=325452 RepID=A0A3R7G4A5_9STRA|nr:hypothetical protein JM16_007998 [Phytophthora kernoviae]RLN32062.1 hypothetical protein BBI17_008219 [Phytophthora kernoviae]RLN74807.1 hypothetical protein BBO99_00008735 [Phytophthora kernoviae]
MAFQARHRWMIQRLQLGLGFQDEAQVEELLRGNGIMDSIARFFRADGPTKLFFYYQKRGSVPLVSIGEDGVAMSHTSSNGELLVRDKGGRKELFVTDGLEDTLQGRTVFFAKVAPEADDVEDEDWSSRQRGTKVDEDPETMDTPATDGSFAFDTSPRLPLDPAIANDHLLTYGVLDTSVLLSIETHLSQLFVPVLTAQEEIEWGQAESEARNEFMLGLRSFVTDVQENLKAMNTGLDLRKPDKRYDPSDSRSLSKLSSDDGAVQHFVELVKDWCKQTEAYLEDNDQGRWESHEAGPATELEYWKRRLQRLMGITEQLKTKECKMVTGVLNVVSKLQDGAVDRLGIAQLLRQWKQIDTNITEASNEAKDNVKYLATLDRFIDPLYSGSPSSVVDALPALMNSVKMIHTIARYYNTTERMTKLFMKITNQMITLCKNNLVGRDPPEAIWDKDPEDLLQGLEACLKLNEAYQEQYRLTKDKLLTMPKGKQFDFSETQIFGKFDLFCRRLVKLIDMFSTIHQFRALAQHSLEGMDALLASFNTIIREFRAHKHDLLDFHNNKFDRDYVEFNIQIADLEASLQQFINVSFDSITSIEQSLQLLKQFQQILQRETLRSDLDSKFTVIFHNYGLDLSHVQELYERHRHDPPVARNLPPVAGNILWSRHLLRRIEEPMRKFESNPTVLSTKDSKKIIKTYNKVARTLVAFEYLWYEAWCRSVESARAGLHATLIIRHLDTGRLFVNFDKEILQLIREARCLDRMGIEVPENARMVMLQEDKFKAYYNDLTYALHEYDRVTAKIIPVTAVLLRPHLEDLQQKLRPGLVTLTWTSMNIDAYTAVAHAALQRLEELISSVLDAIENRIEKNLMIVAKASLVHLPTDQSFALDDFVRMQEKHVANVTRQLAAKNVEIENAVEDVLRLICDYTLDGASSSTSGSLVNSATPPTGTTGTTACDTEAMETFRNFYRNLFYRSLVTCTKQSLDAIKKRVCSKAGTGFLFLERPFFEVDVQLSVPSVRLSPSLDDIQKAINRSAVAVLRCSKSLYEWGQQSISPETARTSLFERLGCDTEIIKVAILLTGALHGTKNQVHEYLSAFKKYDWLWKEDMEFRYNQFMQRNPLIQDFETELRHFMAVEAEISLIAPVHNIAVLSLNTKNLKLQLRNECRQWKVQYSDKVHQQARTALANLTDYIRTTTTKLSTRVESLDALRFVMGVLREVRERESAIEMELNPIADMYDMLEHFLPGGYMDKDEMDQKSVLRSSWRRLVDYAEEVTDNLSEVQGGFKKQLIKDVKDFQADVALFRSDYEANGPMVSGLEPAEAVERLKHFKDLLGIRERKLEVFSAGEELFGMRPTEYSEVVRTRKEMTLLDQLYGLYMDVEKTMDEFRVIPWTQVGANVERMNDCFAGFDQRCKKMPKNLWEWEAYGILRKVIAEFIEVLPIVRELTRESIKPRHWEEIIKACNGQRLPYDNDTFKFQDVLDAKLLTWKEDVEYICESAQKQLQIEHKLRDLTDRWSGTAFEFGEWRARNVPVLKGYGQIIEDLEEGQLQLQAILSMRHVVFFKDRVQTKLAQLSDTADVLELWAKVQTLWMSLESVFTGGDIAKQMPLEAKKFAKIDKDWLKVMAKAAEVGFVVACCSNELLRSTLPSLFSELEKCQKSLEGYLEQKRKKFPRFYFVSNPLLLLILSRGSDPAAVQQYYEKIFDSISQVVHERPMTAGSDAKPSAAAGASSVNSKRKIVEIKSLVGNDEEIISLVMPVTPDGNIEEWLGMLEKEMRRTLKTLCRQAAVECSSGSLREFVSKTCAQFALLGIQLSWTAECQDALQRCRSTKGIMAQTAKRHGTILSELSSWCLTDLGTKLARTKVETLITIQVHQRDCFMELCRLYKEKKLSDANDFEWLKQARFYWRVNSQGGFDSVGPDACLISICDVDFKYAFEYLGCKERLVITPLTDRAYITLSQALGMHLGGAPAGPAGTGKTETVKDLGRSLGVYVIVTNCTDQQRYSDMAKIFKGLCQGGLWGCFDEFNRIELPVLSVVAQQVLAITNAKRVQAPTFTFPGDPLAIGLHTDAAYFITMNPGYQGRQELPENLKALFRGVAMMVPDREIIMKVKLCAVGYDAFAELARKFKTLYAVCEGQLSRQRHYDFGLRNILSVLRSAGATKRENLMASEELLLMTTLRDMNLSKLVAADVPIFLSLLRDIFPGVEPTPSSGSGGATSSSLEIASAVEDVLRKANSWPPPATWSAKVTQLYETQLVRHGIALVGPAGADLEDRIKLHCYLCEKAPATTLPPSATVISLEGTETLTPQTTREGNQKGMSANTSPISTIFDHFLHPSTLEWEKWSLDPCENLLARANGSGAVNVGRLIIPTTDTARALHLLEHLHASQLPVLLVGEPGTGKSTLARLFFESQASLRAGANSNSGESMASRTLIFSGSTLGGAFQATVEADLEKRGGKTFGPSNGQQLTLFMDDLSMPALNEWGDQPTLEVVRQLVETHTLCFLDKDKRGDIKAIEGLRFLAAMGLPLAGKNDAPARLKRHFFILNLLPPAPESNMMLVGVGGSGKQSLARLAAALSGHELCQLAITKAYTLAAFLDDLRGLSKTAGQAGKGVVFLLTEVDIKEDSFLEQVNALLATGEVPGLFPRDELVAMASELRGTMQRECPERVDSLQNLTRFFHDRVRRNLHVVLCLSPVSARFADRCREFPHLVNGCTIDWFLPWPEEALIAVSQGYLEKFVLETPPATKDALVTQMGRMHQAVEKISGEYFTRRRRRVVQTPRSFLGFLSTYKELYTEKLGEVRRQEGAVNLGLQKLGQGAQDVERMKVVLKEEEAKLVVAEAATNKMLETLQVKSLEAKKENDIVQQIREQCLADAAIILAEKEAAEEDLKRAQPFLDEAERAASSIRPNDLNELKKLAKPGDIIKLIFDCVSILQMAPLLKVERAAVTLGVGKDKHTSDFLMDSFQSAKSGMLADTRFLQNIFYFSKHQKDQINDETLEFMTPYMELAGFTAAAAKNASKAAEGLFCWVKAMSMYHEASKVVKPKLEALRIAEGKFEAAQARLQGSEEKLQKCQNVLTRLQDDFQTQMAEKARVEAFAQTTKRKMEQATALIGGLGGEKVRWTEDSNRFVERKQHLVGDCALAAAFLCYCGPFNREYRDLMVRERLPYELGAIATPTSSVAANSSNTGSTKAPFTIPLTRNLALEEFLADVGTISDWKMQGLPSDPLSIQNGLLVARAPRFPLLIDPQGQALSWVLCREAERLPAMGVISVSSPKLREILEHSVGEGKALILDGVDGADPDPLLSNVLDKNFIVRAKGKFVKIMDRVCEYQDEFTLYLTTRVPNPHFSPELQARTLVVDFTVTQRGLEEQLLGQVIRQEQRSLEEQLERVQFELNANAKALVGLDALLLERLSASKANLLDDVELVSVLANTKAKATEVNDKILAAEEVKRGIDEKREHYRPVAARGSVLYFGIVDFATVNAMYQTSLDQFLQLFVRAIDEAERSSLASKRVAYILETLTYIVFRYVNRGLYDRHRLSFLLMVALKILVAADCVTPADVTLFLKAGASRKLSGDQPKPFGWMPTGAWLNAVQLASEKPHFRNLLGDLERSESAWRKWFEDNEPERLAVPDYEPLLFDPRAITANLHFHRLLLVRSLREDRTIPAVLDFVHAIDYIEGSVGSSLPRLPALGSRYAEPITDTVESVYLEMRADTPVLYLLSPGADPTESIEQLARRKRQSVTTISMGEGQEAVAARTVASAMLNGSWVLLQNCHLGLNYLDVLCEALAAANGENTLAEIEEYQRFIAAFPSVDSPEVFGLHPNADLTYRVKEVSVLLGTIVDTQPADADGGSGTTAAASKPGTLETREDIVSQKIRELLSTLPVGAEEALSEEALAHALRSKILGGGLELSLNLFLCQEARALLHVLTYVRASLIKTQRALSGEVLLTLSLRETSQALFDGKVPPSWVADEKAWLSATLGLWITGLLDRVTQLRAWLDRGRPSSFWLAGFSNPQGFLTAMAQESTRAHANERWALDDVVYYSEVTDYERLEQIKQPPREGVLVHGLLLDGAAWNRPDGTLVEQEPKRLFAPLPAVYVTAATKAHKKTRAAQDHGPYGAYEAPVYRYARRTDKHYIFSVPLASRDHRPLHWTLRGVALLCSTDQ